MDFDLLLHLSMVSVGATLSFMLQVVIGAVLVWPMRILDKPSHISMLSKVVFNVLLPCMLFSKSVRSISLEMLSRYWMLLVFCLLYLVLGALLGHLLATLHEAVKQLRWWYRRVKKRQREEEKGDVYYSDYLVEDEESGLDVNVDMDFDGRSVEPSGTQPMPTDSESSMLLSGNTLEKEKKTLLGEHPLMKVLNVFGRNVRQRTFIACLMFSNTASFPVVFVDAVVQMEFKDREEARDLAAGFVSMFLVLPQVVMWSYGLWVLRKGKEKPKNDPGTVDGKVDDRMPLLQETQEAERAEEEGGGETKEHVPLGKRIAKLVVLLLSVFRKAVITPPVIAVMAAIVIAMFDSAKKFLILDPPPIVSSFIYVADMFGAAMVPCSLLVLGAGVGQTIMLSLSSVKKEPQPHEDAIVDEFSVNDEHQQSASQPKYRKKRLSLLRMWHQRPRLRTNVFLLIMSVVGKLLFMPAVALALILILVRLGVLPTNEPIFFLVLLVEAGSPSSKSLTSLSALNENGHVEDMSEMLLAQYLISPITLCLGTILYLHISCTLAPTCNL